MKKTRYILLGWFVILIITFSVIGTPNIGRIPGWGGASTFAQFLFLTLVNGAGALIIFCQIYSTISRCQAQDESIVLSPRSTQIIVFVAVSMCLVSCLVGCHLYIRYIETSTLLQLEQLY